MWGGINNHAWEDRSFSRSKSIDRPTIIMLTRYWSRTSYRMQQPMKTSLMDDNARPHRTRVVGQLSRKMALRALNGLQNTMTVTPSRTSRITATGKPTRRWRTIPLWQCLEEFQHIFQKAWANLNQHRIQTLISSNYAEEVLRGDQSRRWTVYGPMNYWTLHPQWCLLKVKHRVTCGKWYWKVQKHAWLSTYSSRILHKSRECNFHFHTVCHEMHDCTSTMTSTGRHIPFILCVRKLPIRYRFWMIKSGKILLRYMKKC